MRRSIPTAVVALALLAGATGCSDEEQADAAAQFAAGESAAEAAKDMLTEMTSYSHDSLEEDFTWLEAYLTADLAAEYQDDADAIKQFVAAGELTVTGTVLDAGHRVEGENEVFVLAFVDQDIASAATEASVTEELRVRLLLKRADAEDDWIIDDLEILGGQNALP